MANVKKEIGRIFSAPNKYDIEMKKKDDCSTTKFTHKFFYLGFDLIR